MSEKVPLYNEEGQINDPAVAEEMAYAEKPHREKAERIKEATKELMGEVATDLVLDGESVELYSGDSMKLTAGERTAQSSMLNPLDRPGSRIEKQRIRAEIKTDVANRQTDEKAVNVVDDGWESDSTSQKKQDAKPSKSTGEHLVDAGTSAVEWELAGGEVAAMGIEEAEKSKRELDKRVKEKVNS